MHQGIEVIRSEGTTPTKVGVEMAGEEVTVPDGAYLRDAAFSHEGTDLVLAG